MISSLPAASMNLFMSSFVYKCVSLEFLSVATNLYLRLLLNAMVADCAVEVWAPRGNTRWRPSLACQETPLLPWPKEKLKCRMQMSCFQLGPSYHPPLWLQLVIHSLWGYILAMKNNAGTHNEDCVTGGTPAENKLLEFHEIECRKFGTSPCYDCCEHFPVSATVELRTVIKKSVLVFRGLCKRVVLVHGSDYWWLGSMRSLFAPQIVN